MAGKWANENLVAKGITPIVGDIEYLVLDEFVKRAQGISDGLLATCPEAQMVVQGFELTMAENMSMVENWLQAHPDKMCIRDRQGLGAIRLAVKGYESSNFTEREILLAQEYVRQAIDCGLRG